MNLQQQITDVIKAGVSSLFGVNIEKVELTPTRKDFEGDVTLLIFPMLSLIKGNPEQIGKQLGEYLLTHLQEIEQYNVVKGFLNLTIAPSYYLRALEQMAQQPNFGTTPPDEKAPAVIVEYSSPNTNKPLHLGHIRNNLLGFAVANILQGAGRKVYKTQIINDRGIHICKSMAAWKLYGNGQTPQDAGLKGDKLVGQYYVMYDKVYKAQVEELVAQGTDQATAEQQAPIFLEAQQMLRLWEQADEPTLKLWKQLNGWVYEGFEATYKQLGVSFDSYYYESNTYLLGKDLIAQGLQQGVFFQKEDGSVWCDLTPDGLDQKLLLRSDGTSVYMTQDLGTALERMKDYPDANTMIYTVGNEQDYHFKVLFLILSKLGFEWAKHLYHLSYGMVELPNGKMKSREGTVVDADDLMEGMYLTAKEIAQELGKIDDYSQEQKHQLYHTIGLGALKYYILKIDPKKKIAFNPEESIDFHGNTGPFIQYTYARICSILRKADQEAAGLSLSVELPQREKEIIKLLLTFPAVVQQSAQSYNPALVANYTYELVKEFNSFYQNVPILGEPHQPLRHLRIVLSKKVAQVIKQAFALLGIEVPERM